MEFKIEDIKYEIASPCEANWEDMTGDDKCRLCSLCDKNVYNLSQMNNEEIKDLLSCDDKVCTRVYKRNDGTILTQDCPVGFALVASELKKKRYKKAFIAMALMGVTFFGFAANKLKNRIDHTMGGLAPAHMHMGEPVVLMGDIVEPPPAKIMGKIAPKETPSNRIEEIKRLKQKLKSNR